ncbi:MAG: heterodisulfide reductase-related iron-sulfur binding cluster [Thermoplasmatota archaeon]
MSCPNYPDTPCRVNLDFMPPGTALWMYVLTVVAVGVFLFGFWQMVRVWRQGKAWKPGEWRLGLKRLVVALATHRKFRSEPKAGTHHAWVFFGFAVLFVGTTLVAIDADLFERLWNGKLLYGTQYLWFEGTLDAFGVVFLLGVFLLLWRRYVERPAKLHPTNLVEQPLMLRAGGIGADLWTLLFLGGIGVTGFLLEAMRIQLQVRTDGITYASWSFVGNALGLTLQGVGTPRLLALYPWVWWTHFALWTTTLAILPWTKLKHIVSSSLNVFFHDPQRQSRPELRKPFDLATLVESGAADVTVGYRTIRDFTWKDRLALDACTNCGRCEAECPATAAGRPLSPRKLIQDLKAQMWEDYRARGPQALPLEATEAGPAIREATLWSCTTCRACVTACPVDIEHVDLIMEMRRGLVNESKLDENQKRLLVNVTNAGNPYGFPAGDRAAWLSQLPPGVRVPTMQERKAEGHDPEWLWWVGCSGSYDARNQKVTAAIATVLNAAGTDFAILGTEERCTGDPVRRLGEEGRFQQSGLENLATFRGYGVKKVLAQCPHCFNTLKNEYRQLGEELEVVHHAEFIEGLLKAGKLKLKPGREVALTYHDSCYLMRHNGISEAPRNVLRQANGLPVLEMAQNRQEGLCCGAGGANFWYEVKEEKERINVIRVKQAVDVRAKTVATACPFCLTMMSDGIGLVGQEGAMVARDLAEIVAENLDWVAPAGEAAVEAPSAPAGEWSG